jgi:uncharacterized membrane protein affecting hemolysin expression
MDYRKQDRQQATGRPQWIRWMLLFGFVWILLAILYAIFTFQSQRKQETLIESGVAQVGRLAEQAGLPLLEQDIKSLHGILKTIGDLPEVLYASVMDHKNKIIAYTDAGRLLPERRQNIEQFQGVDTWQDQSAMVFSKPVVYAETPIGEIRLALSLEPVLGPQRRFAAIATVALIGLIALSLWVYGRQWMRWLKEMLRGRHADIDMRLLLCPLCGQTADHGSRFCHSSTMDSAPILRLSGNGTGINGGPVLRLSDIGTNPKLANVKDQIIRQCAEIIKRLAAEEPSAVQSAGRNQR